MRAGQRDHLLCADKRVQLVRALAGGGEPLPGHAGRQRDGPRLRAQHNHILQPHHRLRARRPPGQSARLVPQDARQRRRRRLHHLQVHLLLISLLPGCCCFGSLAVIAAERVPKEVQGAGSVYVRFWFSLYGNFVALATLATRSCNALPG